MLDVLGIDPLSPPWEGAGEDLSGVLDALVSLAVEQRQAARERKDYGSDQAEAVQTGAARAPTVRGSAKI